MNPLKTLLITGSLILFFAFNTYHRQQSTVTEKACPSCDLSGRNFSGIDLSNANFSGAILDSADFSNSKLDGAIFSNASLRGAIFDNTSLKSTNRGPTVFFNADLTGARFDKAKFEYTDFQYAVLNKAVFKNTDLSFVFFGPDLKFHRGDSSDPPLFDHVVMNCEFPWLWNKLNIINSDLPNCGNTHSPGKKRSRIYGKIKRLTINKKYKKRTNLEISQHYRVYVSADNGTDSEGCGTSDNPCKSIAVGMSNCPVDSECNVLVEWGEYFLEETIFLLPKVNIYGGYIDGVSSVYQSTIYAPVGGHPIFTGTRITDTVTLNGLILNGSEPGLSGKASKVITLTDYSTLQLEDLEINAGKGAAGAKGEDGPEGAAGAKGEDGPEGAAGAKGEDGFDSAGGAGGKGKSSNSGGKGGNPSEITKSDCKWKDVIFCDAKIDDWTSFNGNSGGRGSTGKTASGGDAAKPTFSGSINNGNKGENGKDATDTGETGKASPDTTGTIYVNDWSGSYGGDSTTGGAGGGGGGGGSGGACLYCDSFCGNKTKHIGTSGGGGGAGGEGGGIAYGGQMGGASFGLLLVDSRIIVGEAVKLTANSGGNGGNGGAGNAGGLYGSGGSSYSANGDCGSSGSKTAGSGGKGGRGGYGAASCGAAGGNGGPAVGVALSGDASIEGNIIFYNGKSGNPGKSGKGGITEINIEPNPIIFSEGDPGEEGIKGIVKNTYHY